MILNAFSLRGLDMNNRALFFRTIRIESLGQIIYNNILYYLYFGNVSMQGDYICIILYNLIAFKQC